MTTYYAIIFELKEDTPVLKVRLRKILNENFKKFTTGIRSSEGLKIYISEGSKLVIE